MYKRFIGFNLLFLGLLFFINSIYYLLGRFNLWAKVLGGVIALIISLGVLLIHDSHNKRGKK